MTSGFSPGTSYLDKPRNPSFDDAVLSWVSGVTDERVPLPINVIIFPSFSFWMGRDLLHYATFLSYVLISCF
jgi:hypothetical protein